MSSLSSFLYRRFAGWITCELPLANQVKVRLPSKFDVASFADVFCHPFYWQIARQLERVPHLVFDCGAHLGHFSILVEVSVRARFNCIPGTRYVLVEPNRALLPGLERNLRTAGILERSEVVNGVVGKFPDEAVNLSVNKRNMLSSTVVRGCETGQKTRVFSLAEMAGDQTIDVLKIDIEGAELDLIPELVGILKRTNHLFVEFHTDDGARLNPSFDAIKEAGLIPTAPMMEHEGFLLAAYTRPQILD